MKTFLKNVPVSAEIHGILMRWKAKGGVSIRRLVEAAIREADGRWKKNGLKVYVGEGK